MSPIKVNVPGSTPMERLTNLTKQIVSVPKAEIEREDKKWQKQRKTKRRNKSG